MDFEAMQSMFNKAQETMSQITTLSTEHKMIMSQYEAVKNAFQQIKG